MLIEDPVKEMLKNLQSYHRENSELINISSFMVDFMQIYIFFEMMEQEGWSNICPTSTGALIFKFLIAHCYNLPSAGGHGRE